MTTHTSATSPLVLGAMMFGTTIDETTSFALLDRFVEVDEEEVEEVLDQSSEQGGRAEKSYAEELRDRIAQQMWEDYLVERRKRADQHM